MLEKNILFFRILFFKSFPSQLDIPIGVCVSLSWAIMKMFKCMFQLISTNNTQFRDNGKKVMEKSMHDRIAQAEICLNFHRLRLI